MDKLGYTISDSTKPLYNSIVNELQNTLSRPINILDLGSSYGINSALMKHDLTMAKLNKFFLAETEPTKKETKQFYEKCSINSDMRFYQIDISDEALKFSEEMNLCEKGINVNLVEVLSENNLFVQTYERGVEDETLSCGTGATAVAIAMYANKKVTSNYVNINVEGGKLAVNFKEADGVFTNVNLIGPATFVFEGKINCE